MKHKKPPLDVSDKTPSWAMSLLKVPDTWKKTKCLKIATFVTGITNQLNESPNANVGKYFNRYPGYDAVQHKINYPGVAVTLQNEPVSEQSNIEIYLVKLHGKNEAETIGAILKGIDWCIDNKIEIISMSLDSQYKTDKITAAVKKGQQNNILMLFAAGNDVIDVDYPGAREKSTGVRSRLTNKNDTHYFSKKDPIDF